MMVYAEISLVDFEFWAGAADNVKDLSSEDLEQLEAVLDDCYPDGIDETTLNDILWFDIEWVYEVLGKGGDE